MALITEERYRQLDERDWYQAQIAREEGLLLAALAALGVSVSRRAWTDGGCDWGAFDALVLRSCWDYFEQPAAFRRWLAAVETQTRVLNPPAMLRWNMDKHYLADLAAAGVAVVPSRFPEPAAGQSLGALAASTDWAELVFKPRVSGAGQHTYRVARAELAAHEALFAACQARQAMLVQRFEPAILDRGEISLVMIAGEPHHAVRKQARAGEFRVQDDHGGSVQPHQPSAAEIAFARQVVAACAQLNGELPLYARVDFVRHALSGPLLMELELIEPELFLRFQPAAAAALAQAVVAACR